METPKRLRPSRLRKTVSLSRGNPRRERKRLASRNQGNLRRGNRSLGSPSKASRNPANHNRGSQCPVSPLLLPWRQMSG